MLSIPDTDPQYDTLLTSVMTWLFHSEDMTISLDDTFFEPPYYPLMRAIQPTRRQLNVSRLLST
jgi:hypothetical protein